MDDYTDDELKRAKNILEGFRTEDGRREFLDIEDGLSVADLQEHAGEFYDDFELLESVGLEFPAMRLGSKGRVPVALSEIVSIWPRRRSLTLRFWHYGYRLGSLREVLSEEMRRWKDRLGESAAMLSRPEAQKAFVSRASEFLASRFAGVRMFNDGVPPGEPSPELSIPKFVGGPPTKIPGCLFEVHTKSPGLAAYWSGAYFISSNYHGAPTTPAKGVLQADTYIFGVSGGAYGSAIQWDSNAVCTLPGTASVHLHF